MPVSGFPSTSSPSPPLVVFVSPAYFNGDHLRLDWVLQRSPKAPPRIVGASFFHRSNAATVI